VYRFRLALVDLEALHRTREYLSGLSIPTQEFLYREAAGNYQASSAIRTSARAHVTQIQELCMWPRHQSIDWMKGFLAGIFDAEGSYAGGILRIANTDDQIIG